MKQYEIENFSFSYPTEKEKAAIENVNLTVRKGEYIVICGKSGCGKTTLLRQLKTVLTPHGKKSGRVLFDGVPLEQVSQREQAAKIGYVMQNPDDQIVTDKVWHELAFGLESLGFEQPTIRARVAEMACYFGIQDWFHRDVTVLSGGQKQLLNLASIMAMQPEVLILDEPTSQLDPIAAADFLNTVRKINVELGTTVLISEHRLEDILPYADRVVVMDEGSVIADARPREITKVLWEQKNDMFAAMPTPARVYYGVKEEGRCPLTVRDGRNWLSGEFEKAPKYSALPTEAEFKTENQSAVSLKELWFRYERNGSDVLRGVSAEIPQNSLFAIVGGNGAGKSTLLKAICGICRPYRGKTKILGKPMERYKTTELFDGCVALLPQNPKSLFVRKRVCEDLAELSQNREWIHRVVSLCRVEHLLDRHPYDLSGGELQRAALAKVLLTRPKILLLDEPTKGIDGFFKETLTEILCQLKANGITVIMVSHDVEFCAENADQVAMFFDGQILTVDTPRRFFGNNSFYTTAANRMSRHLFSMTVTVEDVVTLYKKNKEAS